MSTPGEVEIPARTLTVDGEDYTVGAVGRVVPGDTISVDVAAPENAEYSVYLYNREFQIEQTDRMSGSGRATFSTGSLSPGSYMAAVYDGEILEVYPVVVEGYDVTVEAPSSADGEFDVTVDVADGALARTPPEVQVVMGDDERSVRVDASRVSDGEYRATVSPDGFEAGTYALYGVVRGENETDGGDRVLLAVSDRHEVEVASTATATPTPTAEPDDGNGGGGGSGGGAPPGTDADGDVEVTDRTLLNETVSAGSEAVVRVNLSNTDPTRGVLILNLSVDGSLAASEQVAVAASTDRTVLLGHRVDDPGTYSVAVNGVEVGTVTVTAAASPTATETVAPGTPAETPTSTATAEAVVTPRPTTTAPPATTTAGDGVGFGPVVAVCALALMVLGLRRR
jgi:hypothetical protein